MFGLEIVKKDATMRKKEAQLEGALSVLMLPWLFPFPSFKNEEIKKECTRMCTATIDGRPFLNQDQLPEFSAHGDQ